jgi:hypothetical protein
LPSELALYFTISSVFSSMMDSLKKMPFLSSWSWSDSTLSHGSRDWTTLTPHYPMIP